MNKGRVRGLTTAAGLWTVAAIGLATGGGMYFAAGAATIFALIILWALQLLERKITRKFKQKSFGIETKANADTRKILDQIDSGQVDFSSFNIDRTDSGFFIELKLESFDSEKIKGLIQQLQQNPDITSISWG